MELDRLKKQVLKIKQRSELSEDRAHAAIIFNENKTKGIGYTEFPDIRYGESPYSLDAPDVYVVSAEMDAVSDAIYGGEDIDDDYIITTGFPDVEATKLLIRLGIRKIYFLDDSSVNNGNMAAVRKMLKKSYITLYNFTEDIAVEVDLTQ